MLNPNDTLQLLKRQGKIVRLEINPTEDPTEYTAITHFKYNQYATFRIDCNILGHLVEFHGMRNDDLVISALFDFGHLVDMNLYASVYSGVYSEDTENSLYEYLEDTENSLVHEFIPSPKKTYNTKKIYNAKEALKSGRITWFTLSDYGGCKECSWYSHVFYLRSFGNMISIENNEDFEAVKSNFVAHMNESHPDICARKMKLKNAEKYT